MALALISTAMVSGCISNLIVTKITSSAGSKLYNYMFSKQTYDKDISLEAVLKLIKEKRKKHKKKYFTSFRSLDVSKEKKKLLMYDEILNRRLDFLIKIISLY